MLGHRRIIISFVIALTIVGFFSGLKIAEQQEQERLRLIEVNRHNSLVQDQEETIVQSDINKFTSTSNSFATNTPKKIPARSKSLEGVEGVSAEAYLVGDLVTGKILMQKDIDRVLPFASMSKLITALIAKRIYSATTTTTITKEMTDVPPDSSFLRAGETFTTEELLLALLMNSSNVAGEAIASTTDRNLFLSLMAEYSWEIGMPKSFLADPTGLSEKNSGTARGFFGLAQYLFREEPTILGITTIATTSFATTTEHGHHEITNIHPFVGDKLFLGGKTGHTNVAKDTMLTILNIDKHPIAIIVLRSDDRKYDTNLLIEELTQTNF